MSTLSSLMKKADLKKLSQASNNLSVSLVRGAAAGSTPEVRDNYLATVAARNPDLEQLRNALKGMPACW